MAQLTKPTPELSDLVTGDLPVGVAVWDLQQRLSHANASLADICHIDPETLQPGLALDDFCMLLAKGGPRLEQRALAGLKEQLQPVADDPPAAEYKLGRRYVRVQVRFRPGFGWISVFNDVTRDVADRRRLNDREAALERQNMRFESAINSMQDGLSMFDRHHRLVVVNKAYADIYKLPEELMQPGINIEEIVTYRAEHGTVKIDSTAAYVEGMRRLVTGGHAEDRLVHLTDGRILKLMHHPMPDGGYLGIHRDITGEYEHLEEIKAREAVLAQQNLRFEAAVEHMSHGLSMFDAEHRLVICNEKFAEIYGLPEELTRPGTHFESILAHRDRNGMVTEAGGGSTRQRYQDPQWARRHRNDIVEFTDGRVIDILHRPMTDGGWVSTHQDITAQRQTENRIRHLAHHDPLTGLPNRAVFADLLEEGEAHMREGLQVALVAVDLDHFKFVNDTHGHGVGDAVLTEAAIRLKAAVGEAGLLARLGGDEFGMVIIAHDARAQADRVAGGLVAALDTPFEVQHKRVEIGASVGIAVGPQDGMTRETLLRHSDLALYQAKKRGRGTHCFFAEEMEEDMRRRRLLETGLKHAVENGEMSVMFQPLVDLHSNRISGIEALVRWHHPVLGMVPPSEFIPVAEEGGAINAIGAFVLHTACAAAVNWPEDVRVAVNLSPQQFRPDELVALVRDKLTETGLDPARLELEITESLMLSDNESNLDILHDLKALGVRISMDDFGTGYSSLSYLRAFPFDKIKIDRSFLQSDARGVDSLAIIQAVVDLCKSFGMTTTTEGVETVEHLEAVRSRGCDEAQGYLFSPPLPMSGIKALLRNRDAAVEQMLRQSA